MRALVTGVGGFIGSTLAERLLADGWTVRGVDGFTPYYDPEAKRRNLGDLRDNESFDLVECDLREADIASLLDGVAVVFHQAGQPGVRQSWSSSFAEYLSANVAVTQQLLEAARSCELDRFVFASSSSVYGDLRTYPAHESSELTPISPYGVTKLAAEHLCRVYADSFGVPTVSLRYFTVYGPRQRPDMATHRLIEAARTGAPFPLFGDGSQIRDFTFVDDVVTANLLAASDSSPIGSTFNVCGGSETRLLDLVDLVGRTVGRPVEIDWRPAQPGDVHRTGGDSSQAHRHLGWEPTVSLAEGISRQVAWHLRSIEHGRG